MQLLFILKEERDMDKTITAAEYMDEQRELLKIKRWLRKADSSFYHKMIQYRRLKGNILTHPLEQKYFFPHSLQYLNLSNKKRG